MIALSAYPALVLNADYQPLSYYPLSLWGWQDTIKAIFLDRVAVVSHYDQVIRSPGFEFRLPSVVALKQYIPQDRRPPFTRFNVFLRDRFACQYCRRPHPAPELTFDHVVPALARRQDGLEQHRHRLHPLQLAQGQPAAARVRHAAGGQAGGADGAPAAAERPYLPAELPAQSLAGLSLLGRRAGSHESPMRNCRRRLPQALQLARDVRLSETSLESEDYALDIDSHVGQKSASVGSGWTIGRWRRAGHRADTIAGREPVYMKGTEVSGRLGAFDADAVRADRGRIGVDRGATAPNPACDPRPFRACRGGGRPGDGRRAAISPAPRSTVWSPSITTSAARRPDGMSSRSAAPRPASHGRPTAGQPTCRRRLASTWARRPRTDEVTLEPVYCLGNCALSPAPTGRRRVASAG